MEKLPPPLVPISRSLPRRLHGRSKSAGSTMLKPFEFQAFVGPPPPPLRGNGVNDVDNVDDESEEPETHLREHLEHEMRMREGSTKLLAASQHPEVMLEGAKNLLVSERRMNCFRKELQRRKSGESLKALWASPPPEFAASSFPPPSSNGDFSSPALPPNDVSSSSSSSSSVHDQRPCRAVVSVSEIRIPLMWPEKEHFKNRGFLRRFAVFCLARLGAQIRDTVLVPCVDRSATDVSFHEALVFQRVPPDFECVVEIYAHNLDDEAVSTPSLIRRKLGHVTASVGRTMGRRMAAGVGDQMTMGGDELVVGRGGGGVDGPEFALVARTTLRLDDVDEYGRAFDLEIVAGDATRDKLPLFGQISCRLAARPSLKVKTVMEGELRIKDASAASFRNAGGGDGNVWTPYWCRLCDRRVSCWSSREEAESGRPSYMQMPVSAYRTQLGLHSAASSSSSSTRSSTTSVHDKENPSFSYSSTVIILRDEVDASEYHLFAPTDESREEWRASFHQHLLDQSTWGRRVCESSMELHGLEKSFISSPDSFDSPAAESPFGTLVRQVRRGSGRSNKEDRQQLRKSPKLTRANDLYESVAIPSPRASSSSFSSSSSSVSPKNCPSPRHRRTPSTSSSGSSSKSTPTTPKATSSALTAFPSLDEEELDKLFLKYTSSSSAGGDAESRAGGFSTGLTQSPSKRFNALFPSMTLKPNRTNKKLPL